MQTTRRSPFPVPPSPHPPVTGAEITRPVAKTGGCGPKGQPLPVCLAKLRLAGAGGLDGAAECSGPSVWVGVWCGRVAGRQAGRQAGRVGGGSGERCFCLPLVACSCCHLLQHSMSRRYSYYYTQLYSLAQSGGVSVPTAELQLFTFAFVCSVSQSPCKKKQPYIYTDTNTQEKRVGVCSLRRMRKRRPDDVASSWLTGR